MTDDMIKEHLARAHLAESVTLDAGTWTEVLEEVLRLRGVSYDLLGELSAHRAAQSLRQASEDLRDQAGVFGVDGEMEQHGIWWLSRLCCVVSLSRWPIAGRRARRLGRMRQMCAGFAAGFGRA